MHRDYLGNPVASERAETRQAIDDFVGGFLGYHPRAENIVAAAQADPEDVLANAYAGFLHMFLESPEAPGLAGTWLANARAQLTTATPQREQLTVRLLVAWIEDDIEQVLGLSEQLVELYPRDLFALKLHQYIQFNRGDFPGMLRIADRSREAADDVPHLHGMLAFAYEQCHLLEQAERSARRALELLPTEPWAHHALAHVLLTEGRVEEGIDFLESVKDSWSGLNSFIYTHNWWHLALFYLARGRGDRALDIYDQHVWNIFPEYSQDQVGAVSLLTRLELAGVDVGSRWQAVAEYLLARTADTVQPFLSVQYLYGLARAGRPEADELFQALANKAALGADPVWQEVALPLAAGLLAHARGKPLIAARQLAQALPQLGRIGGSHAQRDLFALIELDALQGAGEWATVQQLLELRRRYDSADIPTNQRLAEAYRQSGLEREATLVATRVQATLQGFSTRYPHV